MDIVRARGQDAETCRELFILAAEILFVAAVSVGVSRLMPAAPTVERASVRTDTVKRDPMLRQMRGSRHLDQWIPLYDPTERIGGVQVYPLVAGVRLLHINIWQFWRGMHPPFFPTPHLLIKGGLSTHDANGWYYGAACDL